MKYNGKNYRTIWMEKDTVCMINQPLLPFTFDIARSHTYTETAQHISNMTVRGAPAIGAAGAYGMVQAAIQGGPDEIQKAAEVLTASRPTANDLFNAVAYMQEHLAEAAPEAIAEQAKEHAETYCDMSVQECESIGEHGSSLIPDTARILTHCNAGWLACVDWGTALSPIYKASQQEKNIFVYVDETRPRCQGSRLTAWELHNEHVPHAVIPDNAAAFYMSQGDIDMVITGADRIALNGDTANKIGTLEKALCADWFSIPMYVAAPLTTFDTQCRSGDQITIEQRDPEEVTTITGLDSNSKKQTVAVSNPDSQALNPAFDITPADLITAFITPSGIISPDELTEI